METDIQNKNFALSLDLKKEAEVDYYISPDCSKHCI